MTGDGLTEHEGVVVEEDASVGRRRVDAVRGEPVLPGQPAAVAQVEVSRGAVASAAGSLSARRPRASARAGEVITNYLATAHLAVLTEALVTAAASGTDLGLAYDAIRVSSGASFVHETEGQVILAGSRDIGFTLELVAKDLGLFQALAERHDVPVEVAPLLDDIVQAAVQRYGPRKWSPNVIRRLEDATGVDVQAPGSPARLVDTDPPAPGRELRPRSVTLP